MCQNLRLSFLSSFPTSLPRNLKDTRTGLYLHITLRIKYKYYTSGHKNYISGHKNSLAVTYNVKCSSFVIIKISLFFNVIPKDIFFYLSRLGAGLKSCRSKIMVSALAATHKQPFPVPYCCVIGNLVCLV
jgi:hypothetical protein